jgi:hypothetical protein
MPPRIGGIVVVGGTLWFSGLPLGALDPADEDPGSDAGLLGSIAPLVGSLSFAVATYRTACRARVR